MSWSSVGVVTDSVSQLPAALSVRHGIEVVPVEVEVDGVVHREGIDLDADGFWRRCDRDPLPVVTTSQPSPGAILDAYRRLAAHGASAIVSVHVGQACSGTVNSARLAAATSPGPGAVVDTGAASFGVAVAALAAAHVAATGAPLDTVVAAAERMGPVTGTSFIVQAHEFARRGGRFTVELPATAERVAVLAGYGSAIEVVGDGCTVDELCDAMVAPMLADGRPIRVAVSLADPSTAPFAAGIEHRLRASDLVRGLVRYRVGPSVAAHTGPGTAGGFWWPADDVWG